MSSDSSISSIPRLTGSDNYKDWADEILGAVLRKGAYSVLDGSLPKPIPATGNADEIKDWNNKSQYIAGLILGTITSGPKVHLTSKFDGPTMWKELKSAYELSSSASRFNALEALLSTKQDGQPLTSLLGTVSTRVEDFNKAQPADYEIKTLMDELFCWVVIRSLDPSQYDLRLSLIKEKSITREKCIDLVKAVEEGLMGNTETANAFFTRSGTSTVSPALIPGLSATPCVWCLSKGRSTVAPSHSLASCTGFASSLEHNRKNQGNQAKNSAKPKVQSKQAAHQAEEVATEFAGTASRSLPPSTAPSDDSWISDSGATSSMTSHREWIHGMTPWSVPIRLGDDSIIYSEGIGMVWFEPVLAGHPAPLVCFSQVLYVPRLKSNLLSTTFLTTQRDYEITMKKQNITFQQHGKLLFEATINSSRLARLNGRTLPAISVPHHALTSSLSPVDLYTMH